jgi:hypothetical protein
VIGPLEDALELKELLDNPGTVAFSRLKYLQRFASDEQIAEFLNGLSQSAANASILSGRVNYLSQPAQAAAGD